MPGRPLVFEGQSSGADSENLGESTLEFAEVGLKQANKGDLNSFFGFLDIWSSEIHLRCLAFDGNIWPNSSLV